MASFYETCQGFMRASINLWNIRHWWVLAPQSIGIASRGKALKTIRESSAWHTWVALIGTITQKKTVQWSHPDDWLVEDMWNWICRINLKRKLPCPWHSGETQKHSSLSTLLLTPGWSNGWKENITVEYLYLQYVLKYHVLKFAFKKEFYILYFYF